MSPQLESQYEQIKALLETLTSQYKTKVRLNCLAGELAVDSDRSFMSDTGSGLCGMAAG